MLRRFLGRFGSWAPTHLALLALITALVGAALVRVAAAARGPALPDAGQRTEVPKVGRVRDALPATPPEAVVGAVALDPFRPDRAAPRLRYQLDESRDQSAPRRPSDPAAIIGRLRLHGVALVEDGSLAVIEGASDGSATTVYRMGDSIGDYRIIAVAGDSVVLTSADTSVVLKIMRPWKGNVR